MKNFKLYRIHNKGSIIPRKVSSKNKTKPQYSSFDIYFANSIVKNNTERTTVFLTWLFGRSIWLYFDDILSMRYLFMFLGRIYLLPHWEKISSLLMHQFYLLENINLSNTHSTSINNIVIISPCTKLKSLLMVKETILIKYVAKWLSVSNIYFTTSINLT